VENQKSNGNDEKAFCRTMSRTARPRKQYRPRTINIPMVGEGELHRLLALQLHGSLAALRHSPNSDAFDAIAALLNMALLALEHDSRFAHEARLIAGGASAMNQIADKVNAVPALREFELRPIEVAVSTFDAILPRLDISRLHLAQVRLRSWAYL